MRKLIPAALVLAATAFCHAQEPLARIAFGSCANQNRPQPIWQAIAGTDPQLFIFMGDNIYADTTDPAKFRAGYGKLSSVPGFAALRAKCPLLATWDDHDYGKNDAGAAWEGKHAAKAAFMDFFAIPADSPVRRRGGVYSAKIFGPEGKRVQVILLDTRWFRGPLQRLTKDELKKLRETKGKSQGPYLPATGSDSTMLGERQWRWLAGQLEKPAELRLIVSSIQVIPVDHGWEKWGNLPRERKKLLDLVRDKATGVILLSGDRHFGEISMLPPETDGGPFYPIYDVTSSGLNQSSKSREANRYRDGKKAPFGKPNFGLVEIDWSQEDPSIRLEIRDEHGKVVRVAKTTLGMLKPCRQ